MLCAELHDSMNSTAVNDALSFLERIGIHCRVGFITNCLSMLSVSLVRC